jgi:hypothetical protein
MEEENWGGGGEAARTRGKKMGLTCFPETSVNNYHTTPHNIPEERRSQPFNWF